MEPDKAAGLSGRRIVATSEINGFKGSLTRRTLIKFAIRIAIVVAAMTAIAYFHVISLVTEQSLGQLEEYVVERGDRERSVFQLAQDNQAILKKEILRRIADLGTDDPKEEFDRLFVEFPDGVTRSRLEGYDGTRTSGLYIGKDVVIDAAVRRRVLAYYELNNQYGPAWHNRFISTFITTPDNIILEYFPSGPNWVHDASAEMNIPEEEWFWVADKEHDPARTFACTGLYQEAVSATWMIACNTPVDIEGEHIANVGTEITLNELFERVINDHLPGAHNFIIDGSGRLIAHPDWMDRIKEKGGNFDIRKSGNDYLKSVLNHIETNEEAFHQIENNKTGALILEDRKYEEYLGVTHIEGPNWHFVTVFPRHLVSDVAFGAAQIVLILGLISLVLEIIIFLWILRNDVGKPLNELLLATAGVTAGNLNVDLDTSRNDELGRLSNSFNVMASAILTREEEHQTSEERVRLLLNSTAEAIYGIDRDGNCTFANPACVSMLGYGDAGELLGQHMHGLTHLTRTDGMPHSAEECPTYQAYHGETGIHVEDEVLWRKDGSSFTAESWSHPILHNGAVIGSVVTFLDITERRRAENALRESEERFKGFAEGASDWFWEMGPDLRFTYHSERYFEITGFRPEDKVGSTHTSYVSSTDMELSTEKWMVHLADLEAHEPFKNFEYSFTSREGRVLHVRISGTPVFDPEGRFLGYRGTGTDITERKRAEESLQNSEARFRTVIETAVDGVVLIDTAGTVQIYNQTCVQLFGYKPDEVLGQNVEMLMPPSYRVEHATSLKNYLQTGEKNVIGGSREVIGLRKDGSTVPLDLSLGEAKQGGERVFVGILRDITERKRAEENIQKLNEDLERRVEERTAELRATQDMLLRKERLAALGQLTGTVAHEIRNPLGAIATSISVVQRKCSAAGLDLERALGRAERSIKRCDTIITELLDFARAKGLQQMPTALDIWLSCVLKEQHIPEGITVNYDLQTNGAAISFDQDALRRAVINVTDNAFQAMMDGSGKNGTKSGGELTVATRIIGERVEIDITDTGPGIPKDILPQVLEPLFSTKSFGTGLGLPTVQRIMDEHGGGLIIGNKEDQGTRVVLWLPLCDGSDEGPKG